MNDEYIDLSRVLDRTSEPNPAEVLERLKTTFAEQWEQVSKILGDLNEFKEGSYRLSASEENPVIIQLNPSTS